MHLIGHLLADVGEVINMASTAISKRKRLFKGNWNPERRRVRVTKEHGTLPSVSNSAALAPGGAKEALFAGAALFAAFLSFARALGRM